VVIKVNHTILRVKKMSTRVKVKTIDRATVIDIAKTLSEALREAGRKYKYDITFDNYKTFGEIAETKVSWALHGKFANIDMVRANWARCEGDYAQAQFDIYIGKKVLIITSIVNINEFTKPYVRVKVCRIIEDWEGPI